MGLIEVEEQRFIQLGACLLITPVMALASYGFATLTHTPLAAAFAVMWVGDRFFHAWKVQS